MCSRNPDRSPSGRIALVSVGTVALLAVLLLATSASAQTYRHTWTSTADFEGGTEVNVNASTIQDQLQLNLNQIETPYLWVANTDSSTVSRIETATGRVLSVTDLPSGSSPSRTAVDIDFNCWVGTRTTTGRAYKLSASDGGIIGQTPYVGRKTRGVAINAAGEIWISSSENDGRGFGWMKVDQNNFQPLTAFQNNLGSYGLSIDPFGRIWTATAWLGGTSVQRVDSVRGFVEQRFRISGEGGNVYGITADINGDAWGALWATHKVVWVDGEYECPNNTEDCTVTVGNGLNAVIDVRPVINAAGGTGNYGGRGIARDANGFVWAVFNDLGTSGWTNAVSYAVKIDSTNGEPILATRVGRAAVGITPDADGFIWVVNYAGDGTNRVNHPCPNGFNNTTGGSVTKLRSSDGSVVATYPTCGVRPYTYSDMAGYQLRSVTLRSGTWRAVHDSGRANLEWGDINWRSQEFSDTTFRVRVRAAENLDDLARAPFADIENGDDMPLLGRYIEVEAFFFTRNDFLGPVLEDLTVSSVCIPAPEICDGFDNDCDGGIDNGNPGGGDACETGLEGICGQGQTVCNQGRYDCRFVGNIGEEVCDGQDNDCDGLTDEGVTNLCGTGGPAPTEVCDGEDNDCDGLTDEGVTNACGECGPVPEEVCDGEDNDCNGQVDEGLTNSCGECGPEPTEICDDEDNDCDGLIDEGVVNDCGECGPTPTEVCNGQDDDCDGQVDERLINACGTCGPTPVEECNGIDDDCDGRIDENVLNACGFCGDPPEEVCDAVDNDCDGDIDEGVANACGGCGPLPTEICNGIDDDCDGDTDEDVTNRCGTCGIEPDEICDDQDNDCDGDIDEGVTNACGQCGLLGADVCDGFDNDCDGDIDEDPDCVDGRSCVEGQCAEPCAAGECPSGFLCNDGFCLVDRCVGLNCSDGQQCVDGECVDTNEIACDGVECLAPQVCVGGTCTEDPCEGQLCPEGQACWLGDCLDEGEVACRQTSCGPNEVCEDGACIGDPCMEARCGTGEVCVDGDCVDACSQISCRPGFECRLGTCVEDLCFNVACEGDQVCFEGNCVYDGCQTRVCPPGEQCGPNGCELVEACGDQVCPIGEVCIDDQCVDPDAPNDGDGNGGDNGGGDSAGTEGCGCVTPARSPSVPSWPLALMTALGAALVWRRRR